MKINKEKKDNINRLARLLYKMEGYKVSEDFDFSQSRHPHIKRIWNQACVSHAFILGDDRYLKYQK